ncbi:ATP-dependent Clp protease proteolytic subunit [Marinimicrobium sp. ABcell2]|uniref:ATP-dependent Clp protease proteolytic subunit n=1 Tax=Marinimicrobium sp. ABcell2 TaxID=3069751 RepID=UPI0027B05D73|nr:ATP-dependent Clp protease proteolytic subunit [Marinimicrobium sp. ABcell2]MDQ2077014.1 ATP-dependent Clp protease proteolytic subunit [Marinimicrobium sp. ABcell2]
MAKICLLSLTVLSLHVHGVTVDKFYDREQSAIDYCIDWMEDNGDLQLAGTVQTPLLFSVRGDVLCLDGNFTLGDDRKVMSVIEAVEMNDDVIMVIRSPGGEIDSAMTIAEWLLSKNSTVVVHEYCASACANYILPVGDRKIVLDHGLVMFHGGAQMDILSDVADEVYHIYELKGQEGAEENIEAIRKDLQRQVDRQETLMERAGVSRHFFRWMDLYAYMPEEERLKHCPPRTHMRVYSPEKLSTFGYEYTVYQGPTSQEEIDSIPLLRDLEPVICYWD